jgi:hypothetical protein
LPIVGSDNVALLRLPPWRSRMPAKCSRAVASAEYGGASSVGAGISSLAVDG